MRIPHSSRGFIALIAVMLLALSTLAFSLVTSAASYEYADSVWTHELRIQARLNAHSCLESATIMLAKDFILNGTTTIPEFGCEVTVINPSGSGRIKISVEVELVGVKTVDNKFIDLNQ